MFTSRFQYTKNPFRLALAEVRHRTGFLVENFIDSRDDSKAWSKKKNRIRRRIWEYGKGTESSYNCLISPVLGSIIKWEKRESRAMKKFIKAQKAGSRDIEKLLNRVNYCTDRKEALQKLDYPNFMTRLDHVARAEEIFRRLDSRT
jgi:hypothetical protein